MDVKNKTPYLDFLITEEHWVINHRGQLTLYDKLGNLISSVEVPEKFYKYLQIAGSWISKIDEDRYILQNPSVLLIADVRKGTYKEYPEFHNQGVIGSYTLDGKNFYMVKGRRGVVKFIYNEEEDKFEFSSMDHTVESYTTNRHVYDYDSLIWLRGKDFVKAFNIKTELFEIDREYPISGYSVYNYPKLTDSGFWLSGPQEFIKVSSKHSKKNIESLNLESY